MFRGCVMSQVRLLTTVSSRSHMIPTPFKQQQQQMLVFRSLSTTASHGKTLKGSECMNTTYDAQVTVKQPTLKMENREDLNSIIRFLPVVLRSSSLFWPSQVVEGLKALSKGPDHSKVHSSETFFLAISDIRQSLNLTKLAFSTGDGFSLFFDELMPREEANKWFREVLPAMADLLLRLPSMLEAHYKNADSVTCVGARDGLQTGLRLLKSQEAGMVLLSQELIGGLLACSFFCLFPSRGRGANHLRIINFNRLFASLREKNNEKQKQKIKCIIHYFERICSNMPVGNVSFERKVLAVDQTKNYIPYPKADSWSKSVAPLCPFEACSGLIEDQLKEALEVDFADKYLGGLVLTKGCVQEEIRFVINPELIVGILFMPCMAENESIEVVGVERFSNYTGYASTFRFCGDFLDTKDSDIMGRRKTRIIAIDALSRPGNRQYGHDLLLREVNKAFCGFSDPCKSHRYEILLNGDHLSEAEHDQKLRSLESFEDEVGIVTGNWGCGVFGGDPELKTMLQWLAASQALRPFVVYCKFRLEALQSLDQVTKRITSNGWSVGDLWNKIVEYSSQRSERKTKAGFFNWLLPRLSSGNPMISDP